MKTPRTQPPEICDFDCPYAGFPPAETAGICRTMSAVHCGLLGELVPKNTPCEWRRRGAKATTGRDAKRSKQAQTGRERRRGRRK